MKKTKRVIVIKNGQVKRVLTDTPLLANWQVSAYNLGDFSYDTDVDVKVMSREALSEQEEVLNSICTM